MKKKKKKSLVNTVHLLRRRVFILPFSIPYTSSTLWRMGRKKKRVSKLHHSYRKWIERQAEASTDVGSPSTSYDDSGHSSASSPSSSLMAPGDSEPLTNIEKRAQLVKEGGAQERMEPSFPFIKLEVKEEPTDTQHSSFPGVNTLSEPIEDDPLLCDGDIKEEDKISIKEEPFVDSDSISTTAKPDNFHQLNAPPVHHHRFPTMASSPSPRASPLSTADKEMLVELVKEHLDVFNDKSTKYWNLIKKSQAWQAVASMFNDITGNQKTATQLRKIWENIRTRAKKDYSRNKAERMKTGGGKPPSPEDKISSSVLPLISEKLEPFQHEMDSDSGFHTEEFTVEILDEEDTAMVEVEDLELGAPPESVSSSLPIENDGPSTSTRVTESRSAQATSGRAEDHRSSRAIMKKKKNLPQEKAAVLKLAEERNHFLREMDKEFHEQRLQLLRDQQLHQTLLTQYMTEYHKKNMELMERKLEHYSTPQ